ncbi:MAG: CAP domain-containing protein [Flavobacteriaceae bacterium]|nr:CAP domain-containing protein [Flavobacteriaceae bacterium]
MKTTKYLVLGLMALLLLACSKTEEPIEALEAQLLKNTYTTMEMDMVAAINAYRASLGLNSVQLLDIASTQAAAHNDHMISHQETCHHFFHQRKHNIESHTSAAAVVENVAFAYRNAESAVAAWIKSPEHQKALVGDYNFVGIAANANADGRFYYTNIMVKK